MSIVHKDNKAHGEQTWHANARKQTALAVFVILICACTSFLHGEVAPTLAQAHKLYVAQFSEGDEAAPLRQSLIKRLQKTGRYQIVDSADKADLIMQGSGEVWIKGYLAINLRSPSTNRQPVYGGFLSVDLVARNGEPVWSYLVTPSKLAWTNIRDDLANNLVKELLLAGTRANSLSAADAASTSVKLSKTDLIASGATFPAPLYRKWFAAFQRLHPEVHITYKEVGSEAGTLQLANSQVDFAASDLSSSEVEASAPSFRHIASVLGGIVPIYNVKGIDHDLRFTPSILAGIFLGRIHKWNDPEIRSANKDAALPDSDIVVIHRSDGSGTTYAWSEFLSETTPAWKDSLGTGIQLKWPIGTGVEGNEKMATTVQETPNSIGYTELVYAIQHRLSFGAVRNSSGQFIHADLDSLAEAAASQQTTHSSGTPLSIPTIVNSPSRNAYPIATFTWLLLPSEIKDKEKAATLIELLKWILGPGQRECSSLGYSPLPKEVADQQMQVVNTLK